MSSFIANTIRFNNNFTTFAVKGGDNNVVPRPNYWSNEIPIAELLRELDGRTIQLTQVKYKAIYLALQKVQQEFTNRFGELDWITNCKSIWHWPYMLQQNTATEDDKIFFAQLEQKFIDALKTLHRSKQRAPVTYVAPGTSQMCLL